MPFLFYLTNLTGPKLPRIGQVSPTRHNQFVLSLSNHYHAQARPHPLVDLGASFDGLRTNGWPYNMLTIQPQSDLTHLHPLIVTLSNHDHTTALHHPLVALCASFDAPRTNGWRTSYSADAPRTNGWRTSYSADGRKADG